MARKRRESLLGFKSSSPSLLPFSLSTISVPLPVLLPARRRILLHYFDRNSVQAGIQTGLSVNGFKDAPRKAIVSLETR
jgi:hypothetical protein